MSSSSISNSQSQEDAANLKSLLTALAAGARAVQALPLSKDANNDMDDEDNAMEDDAFAFESSFPEFSAALSRAQESERTVLIAILKEISAQTDVLEYDDALASDGTQTAVLYEHCATACELLLEQVELYLQDALPTHSNNSTSDARQQLSSWSQTARQKSTSAFSTMLASTVDMPKPQITYRMPAPCTGRTQVFVPPFQGKHPNLKRLPGHGYDTCLPSPETLAGKHFHLLPQHTTGRSGGGGQQQQSNSTSSIVPSNKQYPSNAVAPAEHVPHLHQDDILSFCPTEWELEPLLQRPNTPLPAVKKLKATWIDTRQALQKLGQRLNQSSNNNSNAAIGMIAIDLEAHSYRSFAGMVCLMQISFVETTITTGSSSSGSSKNRIEHRTTETHNFLIDTLKLKAIDIHRALQPALANPNIVKLLHGADSDVQWLQRDFGLYLVHLWDTGRAARALKFTSASYAYLLQRYCLPAGNSSDSNKKSAPENDLVSNIVQNKQKFQLADWRQRPLPEDMQQYAISDTHFLIYIAHHLKWELQQPLPTNNNKSKNSTGATMLHVLDTSRLISLSRYPGPPLFVPTGYQTLLSSTRGRRRKRGNKRQQQNYHTPLQQHVLSVLWDWRDATAREMDESLFYICPNHVLLRLAMSMPKDTPLPGNLSLPHGTTLESKVVAVISKAVADFAKTNPKEMALSQEQQKNQEDLDDETDRELGADDLQMKTDSDPQVSPSKNKAVPSNPSAFFKPTANSKDRQRRGMMSPVMGTEALYKEAGWMTPAEEAASMTVSNESTPVTGEDTGQDEDAAVEEIHTTASEGETADGAPQLLMGMALDTTSATSALDLKPAPSSSNSATPRRSADGFASSRAAREASKSPGIKAPPGLEDDASAARQSSAQIRNELLENHHMNVLGLLTAANAAEGGDEQDPNEDETSGTAKRKGGEPATSEGEEDFNIPRSMREIYKISNRNRKFKKTGSAPPERAPAPTSEKELSELQKAEALLRERGMDEAGFLFAPSKTNNNTGSSSPASDGNKRGNSNNNSGGGKSRKQQDGGNNNTNNAADKNSDTGKDRDMAFFRGIGWIPQQDTDLSVMSECYGNGNGIDNTGSSGRGPGAPAEMQPPPQQFPPSAYPPPYYYSQQGGMSGQPPPPQVPSLNQPSSNNPFFAGAALQGGPLAQNFRNETSSKSFRSSNNNKGNNNNNNNTRTTGKSRSRTSERPEKRDGGRSHVYRSNR